MIRRSFLLVAAAAALSAAAPSPKPSADYSSPDWSKMTLVINVNGMQVGANGALQHFIGLIIDERGRVKTVLTGPPPPIEFKHTVDGHGQTLLPGLIDAHGHVLDMGFMALQLDLSDTRSLGDLQARLRAYADANPNLKWIVGRGWNQELWPEKRFPTAADLDSVLRDRPVMLERVDGHAVVVNSAAMKAAGVTAATRAPSGGRIENGLFVDKATQLIRKAVPAPTAAEEDAALLKAQDILLGYGITATANMRTPAAAWNAFRRAAASNRLRLRLEAYGDGIETLRFAPRPTGWLYSDHLRMPGIKFYADGALGSRGAWLKQPYADEPGSRGLQFHSDAELLSLADRAAAAGFQLATHAIGDAANAQVISTYEKVSKKYGKDRRWRIEHFQIADPADIPRLAPAGIIASMQPTHQVSDRLMAEARLGPNRLRGAYAWRSVLQSGARLAFGSDYPFDRPNPFLGLSAAVSRQDANGEPPGGWIPSERLTFAEALGAYTRGAAYAGFAEDRIGALEPGNWADFILIDRDPTKVDAQALARTQVLETWVAGKRVWERAASSSRSERGK